MRGKGWYIHSVTRVTGITPAYAGKSGLNNLTHVDGEDHPRICGEKTIGHTVVKAIEGSPPHMRGKVLIKRTMSVFIGITPAYAGKSEPFVVVDVDEGGSPPHMRGKVRVVYGRVCRRRITPAYAGKSGLLLFLCSEPQDHPRICGEKPCRILWEHWKRGSPPHMRGKVMKSWISSTLRGITPAYAGKSCPCPWFRRRCRDHPRICGEKYNFLVTYPAT